MKEDGTYIKIGNTENVKVCIRENGTEKHLTYPLVDILRWRDSFFPMEIIFSLLRRFSYGSGKMSGIFQNRNEKNIVDEIDEQVCIPEIVSKTYLYKKQFTIACGCVNGQIYEITTHVYRNGKVNKGIGSFIFHAPCKCLRMLREGVSNSNGVGIT